MPYFKRSQRLAAFLVALCLLTAVAVQAAGATALQAALVFDKATFSVLAENQVTRTPPPAVSAASYVLADASDGTILAEGDAHTRRPMASTTKIMTALVVLDRCDPEETVTVSPVAVGTEGSSVYLYAGEQISVRSLLYALLLSSANDAAVALACHVAGDVPAFAALMNEKAAALSLVDTHFCNPHGLHEEAHYTTAADLAALTAAALRDPLFAEIVATKRYSAPQQGTDASRLFCNHNRLLQSFEGAIGVKTGFTKRSGRCLVSAASREGLTLIAVTLNAPSDWQDHTALLEWGFANHVALALTPRLAPLPVVGGTTTTVGIRAETQPQLTLPASHGEITCTVELPRFLYAGFAKNAPVGRAVYRMGDEILTELPLYTESAVPGVKHHASLWERIKNLFQG